MPAIQKNRRNLLFKYLMLVAAAIVALSLLGAIIGVAAKLIGVILLGAVVAELIVPNSVSSRLKWGLDLMANKVSGFFNRSKNSKLTVPVDNKGELQTENDNTKAVEEEAPSVFAQTSNPFVAMYNALRQSLGYGDVDSNNNGAPIESRHELPSNTLDY